MFRSPVVGVLAVGLVVVVAASSSYADGDNPSGYASLCSSGDVCSVPAGTKVAFGASGRFVFKVLSGRFICTAATFGADPVPGSAVERCSASRAAAAPANIDIAAVSLAATAGDGQVQLNWSYTDQTPVVQEIYRDTDADPSGRTRIASVSSSTRNHTATGLSNGTTYWFWVKNTASGVITNSNAASATPNGGGGGGSITGSSCGTSGPETIVHETIRVTSGSFDGGCERFTAGPELGDGGQGEGQDPVFRVENGATLRNVVIGNNGADGIHVYNGGTIDNVYWMDVGEDALTIKSSGTVTVRNIEGYDADDKFFQVNAASTLNVSNCIIHRAGKSLRQNGDTTFQINVTFDRCDINTMDEGIFRTDSSSSTAAVRNSRFHDHGTVCIGPWSSCVQSGNTTY